MTILHSLNGYPVIVEKDTGSDYNPRFGELDVVGGTATILHYAGKKSRRRKLIGVMCLLEAGCASTDYTNLTAGLGSAAVNYTSDQGSQGNYYVMKITPEELQDTGQDVPVYRVTIDLLKA